MEAKEQESFMIYKTLGKSAAKVSAIGQGCMGIGGYLICDSNNDEKYRYALKMGIDLGMTFIDTAEGYGAGHSEELVGEAVRGIRDKVFVATKVSPENLSYDSVIKAAEGSLKRLNTDYIDLYQIHWPNPSIPILETMKAMERLIHDGKIRHIGVSNFSIREAKETSEALASHEIDSIQVEYNLFDRTIEEHILQYCEQKNITTIAYSPLDQGRVGSGGRQTKELHSIAEKYNKTIAQITLNWLISHPTVIAIPKASGEKHVRENAGAADFQLSEEDFKRISRLFESKYVFVSVDRIKVSTEGEGNRKVYQTVEDAVANPLGFVPSPSDLARSLKHGDFLKPVRLIPTKDTSGQYDYDLIEGRIRYWAWVIAHDGKSPIPAYIRNK